jgi:hypothetical protein
MAASIRVAVLRLGAVLTGSLGSSAPEHALPEVIAMLVVPSSPGSRRPRWIMSTQDLGVFANHGFCR